MAVKAKDSKQLTEVVQIFNDKKLFYLPIAIFLNEPFMPRENFYSNQIYMVLVT